MATSVNSAQRETNKCAMGAPYDGRDPDLLDRILPHVDYVEVTLETISEVKDDDIVLSEDVMSELKNIGKAAKIIVHGVSLSIGSHDGWSTSYLRLLDSFLDQIDVHIPASICYLHRNPWFAEQPAFAGRMSAIGV